MMSVAGVCCWSELFPEILAQIFCRVELPDFIRIGVVCKSWRSSAAEINYHRQRFLLKAESPPPWLMLSSPHEPGAAGRFYSLSERKAYTIRLPKSLMTTTSRLSYYIGSSQGFLISVDNEGQLHATNPVTEARIILPSATSLLWFDGPRHFYRKAIFSPCSSFALVIHHCFHHVSYARPSQDTSWTDLASPFSLSSRELIRFTDAIFHKGLLHLISVDGQLAIFDLTNVRTNSAFPSDSQLVCLLPGTEMGIPPHSTTYYLVESPCGRDLFLITRDLTTTQVNKFRVRLKDERGRSIPMKLCANRTTGFRVFRLTKGNCNYSCQSWVEVAELGEFSVFLGLNYSTMISTKGFPNVNRNCIYFTIWFVEERLEEEEKLGDVGVFNLADGAIREVGVSDDLKHLNWPPPMWYSP